MKLITSLTSPYVRKVRICFLEKKIDMELVMEDVWSPTSKIQESNPLGKVPCLVLEDGSTMFDSRVIAEYADTLSPISKLIPTTGKERSIVKTWEALADGLLDAALLARMETVWAPRVDAKQVSEPWIERQFGKINAALASMSKQLGDSEWCFENHMSLADIAVGCALGYLLFRFPQIQWQAQYPNLAKHYEKLSKRPSFMETLPPA
jgi:glutathione S-transferase